MGAVGAQSSCRPVAQRRGRTHISIITVDGVQMLGFYRYCLDHGAHGNNPPGCVGGPNRRGISFKDGDAPDMWAAIPLGW
jgi:hypothetical protein